MASSQLPSQPQNYKHTIRDEAFTAEFLWTLSKWREGHLVFRVRAGKTFTMRQVVDLSTNESDTSSIDRTPLKYGSTSEEKAATIERAGAVAIARTRRAWLGELPATEESAPAAPLSAETQEVGASA